MPRKTADVVVPAWGQRDAGKTFRITEADAAKAEKWAWRMFIMLKGTEAEVPAAVESLGIVGVFIRGLNSILQADVDFDKLEPLLDQMFDCVTMARDPAHPDVQTPLLPDDIEEVATRAWLRSEVLSLHANFSFTDAASTWITGMADAWAALSTTPTFPDPSA